MKKLLAGLAAVGALAFTACSTDSPSSYDPLQGTGPYNDDSLSDAAWDMLSSSDQAGVCLALSDGIDDYEVKAFVEGANNSVTYYEAVDILKYIAAEKC